MKISVVMPVYNGEKNLKEAMDSIINQTFSDFEFIIINDCSTDKTEEIIQSYRDDRIVYVKNEKNMGVAATLNRGLDMAKGEYIARMDADDISILDRFEQQVSYMESHGNVLMCGSNTTFIGAQAGRTYVPVSNDEITATILFSSPFTHPTVMIKRDYLNRKHLRYEKEFEGMEDYRLWSKIIMSKDGELYNFKNALLKYRLHPSQVTQREISAEKKEAMAKLKTDIFASLGFGKITQFSAFAAYITNKRTPNNYAFMDALCEDFKILLYRYEKKYRKYVRNIIQNICYDYLEQFSGREIIRLSKKYPEFFCYSPKMFLKLNLNVMKKAYNSRKYISAEKKVKEYNKKKLLSPDFSIISNNCWGGLISQKYGIRYNSPTCGLLIFGNDYVKFCKDLKKYTNMKLRFIELSEAKYSDFFEDVSFPVGILGDIEIYFLHYSSEKEAAEKWYRRCKRINWNYLIYKISERENFTQQDMLHFSQLPLKNKLIFASKKYTEDTIVIKDIDKLSGDETQIIEQCFDEADYLNSIFEHMEEK